MKKSIALISFLAIAGSLAAQTSNMSCCAASATEAYAMNASDKNFTSKHDEPLPFSYSSENGKDISYTTADGKTAHAWEVKSAKPTKYYLFVIHEWWGLNDYIKQEAEKLGKDLGVNVIALDLYDNVVTTTREEAAKAMQSVTTDRATAIINGAYAYAGGSAKVFTIGWCFGGGWSLQASLLGGKQAVGCIMYYGQPEKDIERLKTLQPDVLGFFGNLDQYPSPQIVTEFADNMNKAGKKLLLNRYEATHAFANPSNPNFNKEATEDAYKKVLAFVKERIK
ncbi:dienelactone hydrolase family protein [Flavihumibacter profundi]|jgi:carboxymethylenebutenolidase|uniref:dienelactone hydrolase family protein n=1 Tax=Flavihumibacter profundi TaxID=2716883 RepID=UPI001CC78F46|nr:dienelactone hydrolase family protein [Flavihumibacter profundi]MBZ5855651.1 dienelactone hydrolase family protein [Flavihumibacter profundi]